MPLPLSTLTLPPTSPQPRPVPIQSRRRRRTAPRAKARPLRRHAACWDRQVPLPKRQFPSPRRVTVAPISLCSRPLPSPAGMLVIMLLALKARLILSWLSSCCNRRRRPQTVPLPVWWFPRRRKISTATWSSHSRALPSRCRTRSRALVAQLYSRVLSLSLASSLRACRGGVALE